MDISDFGEVSSWSMAEMVTEVEIIVNSERAPNPGLAPMFGHDLTFSYNPCEEDEQEYRHQGHFSISGRADKELFPDVEWTMFGVHIPNNTDTDHNESDWPVAAQQTMEATLISMLEAQGHHVLAGGFIRQDDERDRDEVERQVLDYLNNLINRDKREE